MISLLHHHVPARRAAAGRNVRASASPGDARVPADDPDTSEQTPPAPRRAPAPGPSRLRVPWLLAGVAAVLVAAVAGLALGPVRLNPVGVFLQLLDLIPGIHVHSGLPDREAAIVTQLRLPRVCLGLLVGAMLAMAGSTYQGVFRNPLADPYLLGVAAGAGLGATAAFAVGHAFATVESEGGGTPISVPLAAFAVWIAMRLCGDCTMRSNSAGVTKTSPAVLSLMDGCGCNANGLFDRRCGLRRL